MNLNKDDLQDEWYDLLNYRDAENLGVQFDALKRCLEGIHTLNADERSATAQLFHCFTGLDPADFILRVKMRGMETDFMGIEENDHHWMSQEMEPKYKGKVLKSFCNDECKVLITGTTNLDLWECCEELYKKLKNPDYRFIENIMFDHPDRNIVRVFFGS